jgi:hypothetical protein
MIYNVCINGTAIVGYDILATARHKAEKFLSEYPEDKITVEYTQWNPRKRVILEIGEGDS